MTRLKIVYNVTLENKALFVYQLREKPKRLSLANKKKLAISCCKKWEKKDPNPKCELYYRSSYQLLVSVVLSAQTTDKMVNRSMTEIYDDGFDIDQAIALKKEILKVIQSIGLANTKAKNVFRLSLLLRERHHDQVPANREDLQALPGVGRKTANVIMAELFGEPTLAVDTHVFRVSYRLGLHDEKNADKTEEALMKLIPIKYLPRAHHWFILHGRYVCKARKPLCEKCLLIDFCPSLQKK